MGLNNQSSPSELSDHALQDFIPYFAFTWYIPVYLKINRFMDYINKQTPYCFITDNRLFFCDLPFLRKFQEEQKRMGTGV